MVVVEMYQLYSGVLISPLSKKLKIMIFSYMQSGHFPNSLLRQVATLKPLYRDTGKVGLEWRGILTLEMYVLVHFSTLRSQQLNKTTDGLQRENSQSSDALL
jgi:hypothetical protein